MKEQVGDLRVSQRHSTFNLSRKLVDAGAMGLSIANETDDGNCCSLASSRSPLYFPPSSV